MAPPSKSQRITLSVEEKIRLLDLAKDKSNKVSDLLTQFSIGLSTFYKIKAQETSLREAAVANKNLKRKRSKGTTYDDLNQALSQWFHQVRAKNGTVNGPLIMEKAKQLAMSMGIDFEPSNGWIMRWKENENITFQTAHGEKEAADLPGAEHWIKDVLPTVVESYEKRNIYNADETGLFFKALPRGTLAVRGDAPSAGKQQKERLTALLLCNQDGSDKQVFVIGKAAKPRCFANIRRPPLPYYSNAKAWMLSGLWSQILAEFDGRMRAQKRHILLFADNAACHKLVNVELTNIKIVFLPPNTTSLIQPLDQGIIRNLKVHYRQQLLRKQLIAIDRGESLNSFAKSVTVLQALHLLKQALFLIKPETIQNCFKKAGFPSGGSDDNDDDNTAQLAEEDADLPSSLSTEEFEEWVVSDEYLECYGDLTDSEIIAQVRPANDQAEADEEDEEEPEAARKPTRHEAMAALETLRAYYDAEMSEGHQDLYRVESRVTKHIQQKLTQPKISQFFS